MARNKGTFQFAANFEVKAAAALDPRVAVATKAELIVKDTWPYDGDTIYLYKGILVSVQEENAVYMLVDTNKILDADYSGWVRVDAGAAEQVEVVDNLESEASDKALSAKQGKVLMGEISSVAAKLAGVYTYKGSVAKYENLPTEGLTAGDVYNVEEAYEGNAAGTNYAWTGSAWDALAGIVDLSNYYNKGEVDGAISAALTPVNTEIGNVKTLAEANQTNLGTLQGEVNTLSGTVTGISTTIGEINEKNTAQDNRLTALEELVTGSGGEGEEDQTLLQKVNANTLAIAQLKSATVNGMTLVDEGGNAKQVKLTLANLEYDGTTGKDASYPTYGALNALEAVDMLSSSIKTLKGNAETEGSVDYKIAQAFKWVEVE